MKSIGGLLYDHTNKAPSGSIYVPILPEAIFGTKAEPEKDEDLPE